MENLGLNNHKLEFYPFACLACRSQRLYPLYCWNQVPLSVVGLTEKEQEAKDMAQYTMDIYRCASCGHVFNGCFDVQHIGYHHSSNLVYNQGHSWKHYQDELANEWMTTYQLKQKTIIEIGSGQGHFLQRFLKQENHCIGFEPGEDANNYHQLGIEVVRAYFSGEKLLQYPADALISRHVIEHLPNPVDFLQEIALACQLQEIFPLFFAEVPMIDKALEQVRINDFLYEHVSNFTFQSFRTLFESAGYEILEHQARYQDEVVTIVARPLKNNQIQTIQRNSTRFHNVVEQHQQAIHHTLLSWQQQNNRYALWAATGKGAAFMNMFGLNQQLAPLVVDSDPRKFNKRVPGTGQLIGDPKILTTEPIDHILICSNWHARDIEHEIRNQYQLEANLFVYYQGKIVPLTKELKL